MISDIACNPACAFVAYCLSVCRRVARRHIAAAAMIYICFCIHASVVARCRGDCRALLARSAGKNEAVGARSRDACILCTRSGFPSGNVFAVCCRAAARGFGAFNACAAVQPAAVVACFRNANFVIACFCFCV